MMPEGIENVLSKSQLADLFAFLSFDKPPADPSAKLIPGAGGSSSTHERKPDHSINGKLATCENFSRPGLQKAYCNSRCRKQSTR